LRDGILSNGDPVTDRIFAEVDETTAVDVTVDNLERPCGPVAQGWADILLRIRRAWVGQYPERDTSVRCGTAYISKSGTEVVIFLRANIRAGGRESGGV